MVSFKGKSIANRVADNPRAVKKSLRDFKVYSDLEKSNGSGGKAIDESRIKSFPVKKGDYQTASVDVLKVYDEMGKQDSSVKVKVGRKALADVSNIKTNLSITGASNGTKALRTTTKSLVSVRKSLPVRKGIYQTDCHDVLKGGDENSRRQISGRDISVKVRYGRELLPNVNNVINNSSSTGWSKRSKPTKVPDGKSLYLHRVVASQPTTSARVPFRKSFTGTSKAAPKSCIEVDHTLKKVDTRDVRFLPASQKSKGPSHESFGVNGRKIRRKSLVLTRKSLPVFGRTSQTGSNGLEGNGKISEEGTRKSVKIKVGRKMVPDVSNARKNRACESSTSAIDRSGRRFLLQGIPMGKQIIEADRSSGKSSKTTATLSKIKPNKLTNVIKSNYNRRQSFTSSLLAKSEVSGECSMSSEKGTLPSIDDKQSHLDVAEYIEDIYHYYWVMEAQYPSISNYMASQTHITPKMRGILINWLIEVHLKFRLMQETLFLMVALFDRFLSFVTIEKNEIQLVGLTSLLLASKYEDFWHPKVKELISISVDSYTRLDMLAMEKLILKKLMFRLNVPTPYVFMIRFLKAAQSDVKLEHLAFYLLELCLTEYEALKYKPSLLCASAIYVARCTLQISPSWTLLLGKHAHYEESELRDCGEMILRFHKDSGKGALRVTYEKYMHPDQSSVARIKPVSGLPR